MTRGSRFPTICSVEEIAGFLARFSPFDQLRKDDLLRIAGELRRQAETDAQAAFIAERQRLLESVA